MVLQMFNLLKQFVYETWWVWYVFAIIVIIDKFNH